MKFELSLSCKSQEFVDVVYETKVEPNSIDSDLMNKVIELNKLIAYLKLLQTNMNDLLMATGREHAITTWNDEISPYLKPFRPDFLKAGINQNN